MRFDEIELQSVPLGGIEQPAEPAANPGGQAAPRFKRLLALLIDLSLFVATAVALAPLLPLSAGWVGYAGLGGFIFVTSYYYFVGMWLIWGRSVGGAIFDVRIVPAGTDALSLKGASLRWAGTCLSIATAGLGFALAALPSRLSLADRVSETRCVAAA